MEPSAPGDRFLSSRAASAVARRASCSPSSRVAPVCAPSSAAVATTARRYGCSSELAAMSAPRALCIRSAALVHAVVDSLARRHTLVLPRGHRTQALPCSCLERRLLELTRDSEEQRAPGSTNSASQAEALATVTGIYTRTHTRPWRDDPGRSHAVSTDGVGEARLAQSLLTVRSAAARWCAPLSAAGAWRHRRTRRRSCSDAELLGMLMCPITYASTS
jgi:hypothetical protein